MIARRGFLGMLAAAPTAARITMQEQATLTGIPLNPGVPLPDGLVGMEKPASESWQRAQKITDMVWQRREARNKPTDHLPPHIRAKKSWSPVFRAAVHEREAMVEQAFMDKIREDEAFAAKAARMMFGGGK